MEGQPGSIPPPAPHASGISISDPATSMQLIFVPGGKFKMGESTEGSNPAGEA